MIRRLLLSPSVRGDPVLLITRFRRAPRRSLRRLGLSRLCYCDTSCAHVSILGAVNVARTTHTVLLTSAAHPHDSRSVSTHAMLTTLAVRGVGPTICAYTRLLSHHGSIRLGVTNISSIVIPSRVADRVVTSSTHARNSIRMLTRLLAIRINGRVCGVPIPPA